MNRLILVFLSLLISINAYNQDLIELIQNGEHIQSINAIPNRIALMIEERRQLSKFEETQSFQLNKDLSNNTFYSQVDDAVMLELDVAQLENLRQENPLNILFKVPVATGKYIELELTQVNIRAEGFQRKTSDNLFYEISDNRFYRGIIKNKPNSLVVLTVFTDKIRLLIADETGNFVLGKLNNTQQDYIIYNERKLQIAPERDWNCDTPDLPPPSSENFSLNNKQLQTGIHCVHLYIEADYEIYKNQGKSVSEVDNYIDAIFNESIAVFANAGVTLNILETFVWTIVDPYRDLNSTSDILNNFVDNRPTFNGDLAHFITSRSFGGRAFGIGGICGPTGRPGPYCMSGGLTSDNPSNLPTSSSTFVRIAHEMGHVLGLRHTHACVWNGNNTQIDDCGNVDANNNSESIEGDACFDVNNSILPNNGGGTIMSYCHLFDNIGRNLINGFTSQGNAVLQNTIANATCLDAYCNCRRIDHLIVSNLFGYNAIVPGTYVAQQNIFTHGADIRTSMTVSFKAGNRIEITGTPTNPFEVQGSFTAYVGTDFCDAGTSNIIENSFVTSRKSLLKKNENNILSNTADLQIIPNPTSQNANILWKMNKTQEVTIYLINAYGEIIKEVVSNHQFLKGSNQVMLNGTELPSGIYYIVLKTVDIFQTKTIVIVK